MVTPYNKCCKGYRDWGLILFHNFCFTVSVSVTILLLNREIKYTIFHLKSYICSEFRLPKGMKFFRNTCLDEGSIPSDSTNGSPARRQCKKLLLASIFKGSSGFDSVDEN